MGKGVGTHSRIAKVVVTPWPRAVAACSCAGVGQLAAEQQILWVPPVLAVPAFAIGALLLWSVVPAAER